MRSIIHYLLSLVLLGGLFSCENEIPFDGTETKPMLTLNCFLITDSAVTASLSSSRFFLDNSNVFKPVTNATVLLWVNGQPEDTLENRLDGSYVSTYRPVAGDKIRITASAPGFEKVSAEEDIRPQNSLFEVDTLTEINKVTPISYEVYNPETQQYEMKQVGTIYDYLHRFKIRFRDPKGTENFYRLIAKVTTLYSSGYSSENYLSDFDDIVFGSDRGNMDGAFDEESSEYNYYNIFSDELIDGKDYYLKFEFKQGIYKFTEPGLNDISKRYITIDLQPISKSYYRFLKSLQALDQADEFMSEPVQVYTNVNGGVGIVGAITSQQKVIVLP